MSNPSVEENRQTFKHILDDLHLDLFADDCEEGSSNERYINYATQALAQREKALLTYLSDYFGLPVKEVLKVAELRGRGNESFCPACWKYEQVKNRLKPRSDLERHYRAHYIKLANKA